MPVTSPPKYPMCPPMIETGLPQRIIRGPIASPSLMASRNRNIVMFFGPFSRIVVTPENRLRRALPAA